MNPAKVSHPYNPARLLDALIRHLRIDSDGALSRRLKVAKNVILNIRHGHMPIGGSMLLWMQEVTGIDINELRCLMGDRRSTFRMAYVRRPAIHRPT